MGPFLTLDKSAFQTFSTSEYYTISKYYHINNTPILIGEIIADLRKYPREKVSSLSKRLSVFSATNEMFDILLLQSLLGFDFVIDGRPVVTPTKITNNGVLIDRTEESSMFIRWQRGEFNDLELEYAKSYETYLSKINFEDLVSSFEKLIKKNEKIKNLDDVVKVTEIKLSSENQADQLEMLMWLVNSFIFNDDDKTKIINRWIDGNHKSIKVFSEYGFFILKALLLFFYSLLFRVIGTKTTNIIDLQYLFYLPFCYVFSSCDKDQIKLCKCLVSDYQIFVDTNELRSDINRISQWWKNLSELEKEKYSSDYGNYPPELDNSFTLKAWKRFLIPRQKGLGNRVSKMSKEEKDRTMDDILKKMKAFDT